jgi:hypothetical protein
MFPGTHSASPRPRDRCDGNCASSRLKVLLATVGQGTNCLASRFDVDDAPASVDRDYLPVPQAGGRIPRADDGGNSVLPLI